MVKKSFFDGVNEDIKGPKELQLDGIEIYTAASYTPKENERAKRMNFPIKNEIPTMLLHSGALPIFGQIVFMPSAMQKIALLEWGPQRHHRIYYLVWIRQLVIYVDLGAESGVKFWTKLGTLLKLELVM